MPSGYTYKIHDGEPVTFPEFVMSCARAFGALVVMRDDPADAPIPDKFTVAPWYAERVAKARDDLAKAREMTDDDAVRLAAEENESHADSIKRINGTAAAVRQRYDKMMAEVAAWQPPTEEHEDLKRFMTEQLQQSWEFDGVPYTGTEQPVLDAPTYRAQKIDQAVRELRYAEKSYDEEVDRVAKRNAWVSELRRSLEQPHGLSRIRHAMARRRALRSITQQHNEELAQKLADRAARDAERASRKKASA